MHHLGESNEVQSIRLTLGPTCDKEKKLPCLQPCPDKGFCRAVVRTGSFRDKNCLVYCQGQKLTTVDAEPRKTWTFDILKIQCMIGG